MDYVFPSSNNENLLVYSNKESNNENLDSNHDQEEALFGQFHLPFHNEMQSTTSPILQNHHGHHLSTDRSSKTPEKEPDQPPTSPTKPKRVRKKRSAGKKDRHSKIHTAQGLRDRRMRLSLHIARKFFGLQDMLGFDKASKTIEWLFSKSKKAIDEVTQGVNEPQNTTQSVSNERCQSPDLSDCVLDSDIDFNASASNNNKGKQLMFQDADTSSRKPTESDVLARESRDKARARARERTRERMMIINNLEKSKQIFGENPNDDFEQLQLGFSVNPSNNHYYKESSTSSPLEYSSTHHFFEQAQLDHDITQKTEDYLRTTNAASSSSYLSGFGYNKNYANPPAGWLNSSNTFLGFLGGWDSENYGILPNTTASSVTGDIHEQSLSSVIFPPTNLLHFQSQHDQRD